MGIYVDGIYYARTIGSVVDLMDVERVEILKGPQGTLFGRNTIGGAINITTRTPGDEYSARADVTIGSFQRRDLRAGLVFVGRGVGDDVAHRQRAGCLVAQHALTFLRRQRAQRAGQLDAEGERDP